MLFSRLDTGCGGVPCTFLIAAGAEDTGLCADLSGLLAGTALGPPLWVSLLCSQGVNPCSVSWTWALSAVMSESAVQQVRWAEP